MSNQSKVLKINTSFDFWMNELYSETNFRSRVCLLGEFHTVLKNIEDYISGKFIA